MTIAIRDYVNGCAICQVTKNLTNSPKANIHPILAEPGAMPFQMVSMDFIGPLPKSQGYDAIVVFVDHDSTKAAVFTLCNTMVTAEETATLYWKNIWRRFGLPHKIISDHGTL